MVINGSTFSGQFLKLDQFPESDQKFILAPNQKSKSLTK